MHHGGHPWQVSPQGPASAETKTNATAPPGRWPECGGLLQSGRGRLMKRTGAASKNKTTKRWSQKLQIQTRWSDTSQRIQLLKQSAEFIDNNYAKGIVAADVHQKLGLHARKVNEIFVRFYGVSTSTYLKQYKCKVLFAQIQRSPQSLPEDHYQSAGMTGNPSEKRIFKSLYGVSVEEHWSRSKARSSKDQQGEREHPTLPSAQLEAEETIQKLMATITEPKGN